MIATATKDSGARGLLWMEPLVRHPRQLHRCRNVACGQHAEGGSRNNNIGNADHTNSPAGKPIAPVYSRVFATCFKHQKQLFAWEPTQITINTLIIDAPSLPFCVGKGFTANFTTTGSRFCGALMMKAKAMKPWKNATGSRQPAEQTLNIVWSHLHLPIIDLGVGAGTQW